MLVKTGMEIYSHKSQLKDGNKVKNAIANKNLSHSANKKVSQF